MDLRHNAADDVAVDIGQAAVDAVVANGQSFVVDAEQMQDGGEHVVACLYPEAKDQDSHPKRY